MTSPTEKSDFDPSNNRPANISPLHQKQETGVCITQNVNEIGFSSPINLIRDMHEEDRARAQNMPMLNLMQPPAHPLLARNIRGGAFQSDAHPVMVNIDNLSSGGTQSNSLQRPQIDSSFLSVRGNTADEFQPSSQGNGMGTGANLRPDSVTFSGIYGPRIDRNILTVGANMDGAYQIHDQQELMVRNRVRNAVPSNNPICPEQTLNLGFRDNTVNALPSNICAGIPTNNRTAATPYSFLRPQVDGSSLRLGGNFGDLSWPSGNSGNTFVANAGSNPTAFGTPQRPQGDVQHCFPIQGGRIGGIRSNRGSTTVNLDPNGGSQVYSGAASVPISGIQAQVLANQQARLAFLEQARRARVAQLASTPMQIPNELVHAQLRQAQLNNTRGIFTNSSMVPPFVGTVGSTSRRDHPGHTAQSFEATIAQGTPNFLTNIADMRKHVQQANVGTPIPSSKGKRSPAERSQNTQSSKVLLGTSVSSGKPVPVPVRGVVKPVPGPVRGVAKPVPLPVGGVAKPVPVPVGSRTKPAPVPVASKTKPAPTRPQLAAKSKVMPPTSAIASFPQHKRTPQISSRPASSPDYIRWKDPNDSSKTIDENCCLCKRNLTFTPDPAPVSQPSIPPEVAVLPCGHTFHDECLQRITPPEMSKEPPCIPCALETHEKS